MAAFPDASSGSGRAASGRTMPSSASPERSLPCPLAGLEQTCAEPPPTAANCPSWPLWQPTLDLPGGDDDGTEAARDQRPPPYPKEVPQTLEHHRLSQDVVQ